MEGIPTLASNFIPPGMTVHLHSENGLLDMGKVPMCLIMILY